MAKKPPYEEREKRVKELEREAVKRKRGEKELRKTGIDFIGNTSWGTHFCQFYQTPEDLIDILVPYFKVGLENNEFCMWITAEPLNAKKAKASLKKVVRNLDDYIEKGQIEILDFSQWYAKSGKFNADEVLDGWVEKEKQALERGFDGLRLTGNTFWLEDKDWRGFTEYEETINNIIGNYKMIAICSYSLDKCGATEIVDVVANHQFALVKRENRWEIIESAEGKQEALRESEENFRELAEKSPLGVVIADEKGNQLYVNKRFAEITEYSIDELIGMNGFEVLTRPKDKRKYIERMEKRMKGEPYKEQYERVLLRKDGTAILTEFFTTKTKWKGEMCPMMIVQDITERKQTEEALRISQEYSRNVIDSSMDMIITSNKDRNIVEFNKAAEENFGYGREEVIGKLADILYADPQEGLAIHKTTVEQGECAQGIFNRRKNGEVFPSFLSASLLRDAQGEVIGVMGVSRDITPRKQAEEQIQASLKEKEALLGEIHHRVKNNLQIISSLLDMRAMRTDNKEMINVFEDTRSKIHTMALIHEQLYRSEKFNEINIGVYIRELVNYLLQVHARRNVSVTPHVEYSSVYLSITQAIPCALVINELISNAFKHAFKEGQKGTIQIFLKKTDLDEIYFQVKDDGIGIPKDIDIYTANSLGFKLLRNTVQDQLMGRLSLQKGSGTTIVVEFKILKEE